MRLEALDALRICRRHIASEAGICLLYPTSVRVSLNTDVLRLSSIAPNREILAPSLSYTCSSGRQQCPLSLSLPVLPPSSLKTSGYPTTPCGTSQPPLFDALFPPFEVAASPLWRTILLLPHPAPFVRRIEPCKNSSPGADSDMPRWRKWCD